MGFLQLIQPCEVGRDVDGVDRDVDVTGMSQGPGLSTQGAAKGTSKLCRNVGVPWGCMIGDTFILLENGSRRNLSPAAALAAEQPWCLHVGSLLTRAL